VVECVFRLLTSGDYFYARLGFPPRVGQAVTFPRRLAPCNLCREIMWPVLQALDLGAIRRSQPSKKLEDLALYPVTNLKTQDDVVRQLVKIVKKRVYFHRCTNRGRGGQKHKDLQPTPLIASQQVKRKQLLLQRKLSQISRMRADATPPPSLSGDITGEGATRHFTCCSIGGTGALTRTIP
jgi:hypothetical protein